MVAVGAVAVAVDDCRRVWWLMLARATHDAACTASYRTRYLRIKTIFPEKVLWSSGLTLDRYGQLTLRFRVRLSLGHLFIYYIIRGLSPSSPCPVYMDFGGSVHGL